MKKLIAILLTITSVFSFFILFNNEKIKQQSDMELAEQNFALIDEETVYKNLMLSLQYVKENKKRKKEMIDSALFKVGLEGCGNRKVFELSGGEQQRVAIARCMLKPCKIVLADEPTGSLDRNNRDKVMELLSELNKEGKTIIIVTHDKEVAQSCNRVISL